MNNVRRKPHNLILLCLVVLIGIVLRFYQLGQNPPSLDWDEVSIGYNAYSILNTAKDEYGNFLPLSFRSFDDYKPPVFIYLTVPSIALFGLTEFAVRLPAAFIGIIAILAVYFFVKEIFINWNIKQTEYIALVSAFFLAVSPWHLQFSRASFEGNIGMCFLILSLLFFFKGMKKNLYYFLFVVFFVLSLYSYHSFRFINPVLLVILMIFFYKDLLKQKIVVGFSILVIILLSLPIYTSFWQQEGTGARLSMVTLFSDPVLQQLSAKQVLIAKQNHDVFRQVLYNRRIVFIPEVVKGYVDHFNFDFLFLHGDGGLQHHAYNMGMMYIWDFPFIALGIVYLFKKRTKRIVFLFLLFLLAPFPAALTTGTPHPVRAIAMIPAFQIFTAAGFVWFFSFLKKKKIIGTIVILGIILLFCCNVIYYLYSYYAKTPIIYGYFWQYGNKQAILYAKQHEKEYDHIIMTYIYDQPYIYYLFYDKINPVWYQKNWNYGGNVTIDRFYRQIGKYEFRNISPKDFSRKNILLIGTPREIPKKVGLTKQFIQFPDGRLAYKIIAL